MNVEGLLAIASNSEPSKGYLYLIIIIPIGTTVRADMTAGTQHLPSIILTDPHNEKGVPSPAQSPAKEIGGFAEGLSARVVGGGRPTTPGKHGR